MHPDEIAERFAFHPATPTTGPQHDAVRALCGGLARELNERLPESREKSLALTAVQEAMMWANAAIAIHTT